MLVPDNLLFTKDHEWAKIEEGKATIGITDFAQSSLGDITFVDLPKVGQAVRQSVLCATVESVKRPLMFILRCQERLSKLMKHWLIIRNL